MRTEKSSDKIFIIIIALLLVANIATLAMLLSGGGKDGPDDHHNAMRNYLKNEVGFTEQQLVNFDTVKSQHRSKVKQLFDEMRDRKTNSLKQLGSAGFSDSTLAKTAAAAGDEQQSLELNMLQHLREIRNICTPAQRAVFDTGFYKVMARPPNEGKKIKEK